MNDKKGIYVWGHERRFNDFASYFKKQFSQRVQKLSVDAGFSCPNRDGTIGENGCSYCNNTTFKPSYCKTSVSIGDQVKKGIDFFEKKYKEMRYLTYLQAFTNTHAPLEKLIPIYKEALSHPKVIGLVIATRPDALNDEVLDYLEYLASQTYLVVELGVESHLDSTLNRINRGHSFEQSRKTIKELYRRKIHIGIHLILGLPGEERSDFLMQAKLVSELPVNTIKLHQLQIHRNTRMEMEYLKNPEGFHLFHEVEDYIELVIDYLELLNPGIVVERFVSQSPISLLVAPKWGLKNFEFVAKLEKRMKERETWQGRLYKNSEV